MFDFSLGELIVLGGVSLVVLGPEKLPKVARTLGAMLARAQRYMNDVKADIEREIELDNLRQMQADMTAAGRQIKEELVSGAEATQRALSDAAQPLREAVAMTGETVGTVGTAVPHEDATSDAAVVAPDAGLAPATDPATGSTPSGAHLPWPLPERDRK